MKRSKRVWRKKRLPRSVCIMCGGGVGKECMSNCVGSQWHGPTTPAECVTPPTMSRR